MEPMKQHHNKLLSSRVSEQSTNQQPTQNTEMKVLNIYCISFSACNSFVSFFHSYFFLIFHFPSLGFNSKNSTKFKSNLRETMTRNMEFL